MSTNLRRDHAAIEAATTGTGPRVPLVLGDDGRQCGEFGDLMPGRFGVVSAGLGGQGRVAVFADRRHIRHDRVDPLRRQTMAMMSGMPRLSPRLASGRRLDDRLGCPRRIGRRGRGTVGRIASKLSEEFSDLGFQDNNPSQGGVEFTTQPDAFDALGAWSRSVRDHEEAVYIVAEQEQGLSPPPGQNRCR
jgi:hypothetical protein